jgi:hypothetical protein
LFFYQAFHGNDGYTHVGQTDSNPTAVNPKDDALANTAQTFTWNRGGFDSIMMANFTVKNNNKYTIKDLGVKCLHYASSRTLIDGNDRTIYDVVADHSTKRFPNFNMGFILSQAVRSNCQIVDLKIVQ